MGMLQTRRDLDLPPESLGADARRELGREDLDDYPAIETRSRATNTRDRPPPPNSRSMA